MRRQLRPSILEGDPSAPGPIVHLPPYDDSGDSRPLSELWQHAPVSGSRS